MRCNPVKRLFFVVLCALAFAVSFAVDAAAQPAVKSAVKSVYAAAQSSFGIALYDVDRLYDTIPSKFYDDRDYTPSGSLGWSADRYARKIANTAAVLDSMAMPLVALCGVENEQVVRDLTEACKADYAYLHRTSDFSLGMDFALLYYGDIFLPVRVEEYGYALCVEGEMAMGSVSADKDAVVGEAEGRKIAIIIARRPRNLEHIISRVRQRNSECSVIVLGEMYKADFKRLGLRDVTSQYEQSGYGTAVKGDRWVMTHRVATDMRDADRCKVYIKRWLLDRRGYPKPTYRGGKYEGGYSLYLPVCLYFD